MYSHSCPQFRQKTDFWCRWVRRWWKRFHPDLSGSWFILIVYRNRDRGLVVLTVVSFWGHFWIARYLCLLILDWVCCWRWDWCTYRGLLFLFRILCCRSCPVSWGLVLSIFIIIRFIFFWFCFRLGFGSGFWLEIFCGRAWIGIMGCWVRCFWIRFVG